MFPVVRYGKATFLVESTFLHIPPVVVGPPDNATGETWFKSNCARAVVTAQGNAFQTDTLGVDFRSSFQPINDSTGPMLAVIASSKTMQTQCLAGTWLIDDKRRYTALGQPYRQANAVFHFFGGVQSVDLYQQRSPALDAFCAHIEP